MSGFLSGYVLNLRNANKLGACVKLNQLFSKKCPNNANKNFFCHTASHNENENKYAPFLDVLHNRRLEARRSIIVQVQSSQSFKELYNYCDSIGSVKSMFHYTSGAEPLHFIIVEFDKEDDVKNILLQSSHLDDTQAVPVQSSFLWFRATQKKPPKLKQNKTANINIENGTHILQDFEINEYLRKATDISDQMKVLHDITKLNDVGSRLRFLTAKQIEDALSGMFPYATAFPFGSSVNGCGKMGCDLDLVLTLANSSRYIDSSRLVFHCKASTGTERSTSQRHMETLGDLLQLFLPGCSQVRRILQARVPIIKYHQQLTDVECDLSMANMSGVHMSDFLYIMGSLDDRVRPLIFTIKKWACEVGLTNSSPGRWITNFSLTLLVLAFLQKPLHSPPVLPSLNTLIKQARKEDKYITEEGLDCSFLRDLNKLHFSSNNTDNLASLLKQFFEFYAQFDFTSKAICLNEAVAITKPDYSPMYIVNPLERGLNVSKNISVEEVDRVKNEMRNAAWILESQENKETNWGVLSLFTNTKKSLIVSSSFAAPNKSQRIMDVRKLFEDDGEADVDEAVRFKNDEVRKQVQNIKKQTEKTLKSLESSQDNKIPRIKENRRR